MCLSASVPTGCVRPPSLPLLNLTLPLTARWPSLVVWLFVNGLLGVLLLSPSTLGVRNDTFAAAYMGYLFIVVFGLSLFRFIFSTIYAIKNRTSS